MVFARSQKSRIYIINRYQGSGTTILRNTLSKVRVSRGTAPLAVPSTFGTAKIVSSVTEINPVKAIVERAADCFLLSPSFHESIESSGSLVSGENHVPVPVWCNDHTALRKNVMSRVMNEMNKLL